jgi:hypothetical protein
MTASRPTLTSRDAVPGRRPHPCSGTSADLLGSGGRIISGGMTVLIAVRMGRRGDCFAGCWWLVWRPLRWVGRSWRRRWISAMRCLSGVVGEVGQHAGVGVSGDHDAGVTKQHRDRRRHCIWRLLWITTRWLADGFLSQRALIATLADESWRQPVEMSWTPSRRIRRGSLSVHQSLKNSKCAGLYAAPTYFFRSAPASSTTNSRQLPPLVLELHPPTGHRSARPLQKFRSPTLSNVHGGLPVADWASGCSRPGSGGSTRPRRSPGTQWRPAAGRPVSGPMVVHRSGDSGSPLPP